MGLKALLKYGSLSIVLSIVLWTGLSFLSMSYGYVCHAAKFENRPGAMGQSCFCREDPDAHGDCPGNQCGGDCAIFTNEFGRELHLWAVRIVFLPQMALLAFLLGRIATKAIYRREHFGAWVTSQRLNIEIAIVAVAFGVMTILLLFAKAH